MLTVARDGHVVHVGSAGDAAPDTVWRIYSMTKPITSVAAMMLYEEGAFELKDPVARVLPEFARSRVWRGGTAVKPVLDPVVEPVRMWHLLTHTSGLTYGFHHSHPVDRLYREAGFEWAAPPGLDLAGCCAAWAELPLLFQPGAEWNYGVSTDVLGRVVEVISGQSLDAFFAERILGPLGMDETAFWAHGDLAPRLAPLYIPDPNTGRAVRSDAMGEGARRPPTFLSGGGGLVSTAADYGRFCSFLASGGELDGVRLLGPRTLAYMTQNHLPGHADLEAFGRPLFSETTFDGVGFGLGFSVVDDPVAGRYPASHGEFGWGGAASTAFWIDPVERMTVLFMTQLLPSSTHPIRSELHQLVHQALVSG